MKLPLSNCENCNSPQKFPPKRRFEGDEIVTYVVCLMCRTEFEIDRKTREQARQQRRRNQAIRRHR